MPAAVGTGHRVYQIVRGKEDAEEIGWFMSRLDEM
jgi:hypothetical protein